MKTPQGLYYIIDITEFLPGRHIPSDWCEEANKGGPFFFLPSNCTEETQWGGSRISLFTKFPMLYSVGSPTAEAALEEATRWEAGKSSREIQQKEIDASMVSLFETG